MGKEDVSMKEKIILAVAAAIAKPVFELLINIGKWGVDLAKLAPGAAKDLVKWWNGKTIAIIGATASGKNSFYNCLSDKEPPTEHINTRGMERVEFFKVKRNISGLDPIDLRCKRSVNVGGEDDDKDRYWYQACSDADFIFYLIDMEHLNDQDRREAYDKRIGEDLKWLGSNLSQFKRNCKVHLLLNKIDCVLDIPPSIENCREFIEKEIDEIIKNIEGRAKSVFDRNASFITGVSPICMVDRNLFNYLFDSVLVSIYRQEHKE